MSCSNLQVVAGGTSLARYQFDPLPLNDDLPRCLSVIATLGTQYVAPLGQRERMQHPGFRPMLVAGLLIELGQPAAAGRQGEFTYSNCTNSVCDKSDKFVLLSGANRIELNCCVLFQSRR